MNQHNRKVHRKLNKHGTRLTKIDNSLNQQNTLWTKIENKVDNLNVKMDKMLEMMKKQMPKLSKYRCAVFCLVVVLSFVVFFFVKGTTQ